MPSLGEAPFGGYRLGMPGMVASHTSHNMRQSLTDSAFINKLVGTNLYYGTACIINPVNGQIAQADVANGQFFGVLLDPENDPTKDYYAPEDRINVGTSGDFWVRVDPAVTIVPLVGVVYYIPTAGATLGYFTNVSTNNVAIPAKFLTPNHNGLAVIALNAY